jgi:hypothetical protein
MKRLILWWFARQRRLDLEVLWPSIQQEAPDLETARAMFAIHAYRDPAWLVLSDEELFAAMEGLTQTAASVSATPC